MRILFFFILDATISLMRFFLRKLFIRDCVKRTFAEVFGAKVLFRYRYRRVSRSSRGNLCLCCRYFLRRRSFRHITVVVEVDFTFPYPCVFSAPSFFLTFLR